MLTSVNVERDASSPITTLYYQGFRTVRTSSLLNSHIKRFLEFLNICLGSMIDLEGVNSSAVCSAIIER